MHLTNLQLTLILFVIAVTLAYWRGRVAGARSARNGTKP